MTTDKKREIINDILEYDDKRNNDILEYDDKRKEIDYIQFINDIDKDTVNKIFNIVSRDTLNTVIMNFRWIDISE